MFNYRKKMRARIKEASRLSKTKQLLKATEVIQQTLREALTPEEAERSDPAAKKSDESVVEGTYRVVEPDAPATGTAGQEEIEVIITTSPEADEAPPKDAPKQKSRTATPDETATDTGPGRDSAASDSGFSIPIDLPVDLPIDLPSIDLRQHIRQLRERIANPRPAPNKETVAPTTGQFIGRTYSTTAGQRPYKLYIPGSYQTGQALPLVVMLHGCTQSPDDFAAGTQMNFLAERHNFLVLYPAQTFKANKGKCWNWFKEGEQRRDHGESAIIADLTRHIVDSYGLDGSRVYVAGISAGGAMAMVMGTVYPDIYAGIGVHSGIAYGLAQNMPSAFAAMKRAGTVSIDRLKSAPGGQARPRAVPTIVFHGDEDGAVHPNNGQQIITQGLKLWAEESPTTPKPVVSIHRGQIPEGHAYTRSVYAPYTGAETALMEHWLVHGAGHAWAGGSPHGSYTDSKGPDATGEMYRFFSEHRKPDNH